jgi:molybdopterin molybdotransferase
VTKAEENSGLPSFLEARALVESYAAQAARPSHEEVALLDADGRILAEDIRADRNFPPFARSTRDGFAVRAADLASIPARLRVVAEIAAGALSQTAIQPSEAAEIMTGAALPESADAVVMVEYTRREGEFVIIERAVKSGDNFVPCGAEAKAADLLLGDGSRINPAAIAIAASVGKAKLKVYRKPQIAILATGDELVELDEQPNAVQIRNSNSYSLAAQVRRAGGEPRILPIGRDELPALTEAVRSARSSDLLLLSGGVSMGKYDLVEQVLAAEGAEFKMTGARIQPGKPVVFGVLPGPRPLPFFGLPGNPISTMATFDLFVTPMLHALAGATAAPLRFARAVLEAEFKTGPGLTRFLPASLTGDVQQSRVKLIPWHGSGDLAAIVRANCYLVVPPDLTTIAAGAQVTVLLKD